MTGVALVNSLWSLLQETLDAVRRNSKSGMLQLYSIVCSAYPDRPVRFGGGEANLLYADRPLPDRVTFTFKDRVFLHPGQAAPVDVCGTADLLDNPQLTGRVETVLPRQAAEDSTLQATARDTGQAYFSSIHFHEDVVDTMHRGGQDLAQWASANVLPNGPIQAMLIATAVVPSGFVTITGCVSAVPSPGQDGESTPKAVVSTLCVMSAPS